MNIFSFRSQWFFLVACGLLLGVLAVFVPRARAIESGASYYTSDPGSAPWNYVGAIASANGDASGVYLGDYNGTNWVLTAGHVGAGSFTLGGFTYDAIAGSAFSIANGNGSPADLSLFQISGTPGLADLTIAASAPPGGATVQMIGFGGGKSWGTNTVYGYSNYTLDGTPYGGMGIVTLASGEGGNGAQGVSGDSGGGMFYDVSGNWILAGTLSGVGDIMAGGGTDLGQGTVAVDLADYSGQILSDIDSVAIPEPSNYAVTMGLGVILALPFCRRRSLGESNG